MFAFRVRQSTLRSPARTLFARFESTEAYTPAPVPEEQGRTRRPRSTRPFLPRTHYLAIPLYDHSPEVRDKVTAFCQSIVNSGFIGLSPETLARWVPQNLHLRLGSFNIAGFEPHLWQQRRPFKGQSNELTRAEQEAIPSEEITRVLQELKAPIREILTAGDGDGALHVPLGCLRPLLHGKRSTFNPHKVNLLFLEPTYGPESEPLRDVNELVFKRFHEAGMWVDQHRPSVFSMTLVNTRHTAKSNDWRQHFSVLDVYNSEAFKALEGPSPSASEGVPVDDVTPRRINLGEAIAKSLQIKPLRSREQVGAAIEPVEPIFKLEL